MELFYICDLMNGLFACLGRMDFDMAYAAYESYISFCGYDMSRFTTLTPLDDPELFSEVIDYEVYRFAYFSCVDYDSEFVPVCVSF